MVGNKLLELSLISKRYLSGILMDILFDLILIITRIKVKFNKLCKQIVVVTIV